AARGDAWGREAIPVRPLRDPPLLMSLITTMGLGMIIENLMRFSFGPQTQPLSAPLSHAAYQCGDTTVSVWELATMAVVVVAIGALHYVLHRTDFGAAVRAIAE